MNYMRQLGMEGCHSNSNNKIWTFWSNDFEVKVQDNSQQQVTFQVCHKDTNVMYHLTNVYAKCRTTLRKELWTELVTISNRLNGPWAVVGDFNVISDSTEKKGGRPHSAEKSLDFVSCLSDCGIEDAGYVGNIFTWCNNRGDSNTIWKRLDRLMYNSSRFDQFGKTTVTHLTNACSDHVPVLVQSSVNSNNFVKYFRFLNIWTEHEDFLNCVRSS
ncbi:hypothetical protein H5410_053258 [Solanum commersonii]|uniref:Endonuclease/exonuclease/phosphatase domain-containing protein n=1 Tax=Solanum commersonii TaxID=4109 RepID=A0A9J5X4E7_SOLCO|nr:hypothetical protein H5410_053258 [Solanum commersonii]